MGIAQLAAIVWWSLKQITSVSFVRPNIQCAIANSQCSQQPLLNQACLHGVGDPGLVGLVSFVFHALGDTKQNKPTLLDRGPPLHVNRV